MTVPSPDALARRLVTLSHLTDKAADDAALADEEVTVAKAAYRVAYARAFVEAEGSAELRKCLATIKAETERFTLDLAEQKLRASRDRIFTLKEQTDIARALNALMRSEWNASGMGGA